MSQQINLFNPIFLKQRKIFGAVPMLETLGAITVGALALVFYGNYRLGELERQAEAGKVMLAAREASLAKVVREFAPRQKSATLESEVALTRAEVASLRQVETVLQRGELGNTAGYAEYFRAFSRQNVNGLWLTGVSIAGAGNDIGVQGRAMQATLIPSYIARLTGENVMRGKTFGSLQIGTPAPAAAAPGTAATPAAAPAIPRFVEFSLQSQTAEAAK